MCNFIFSDGSLCPQKGYPWCSEHKNVKCDGCKQKQATRACNASISGLFCGTPICEDCVHPHCSNSFFNSAKDATVPSQQQAVITVHVFRNEEFIKTERIPWLVKGDEPESISFVRSVNSFYFDPIKRWEKNKGHMIFCTDPFLSCPRMYKI